MDMMELEQVIRKALKLMQNDAQHFILLVMCGDNRYSLEKFLVEADEIGRKNRLKIAADAHAATCLSKERLQSIHGVESVVCGVCTEEYDGLFSGVDTVAFGSMDIGTASKISNLDTDTLAARIASEAFMRGIRVISNNFLEDFEIKNESYRAAVNKVIQKLNGFGVTFVPLDGIKKQFAQASEEHVETPVKIITEDAVKKLNSHELRIAQDAVVTPLAKDILKEKKIVLTRGN